CCPLNVTGARAPTDRLWVQGPALSSNGGFLMLVLRPSSGPFLSVEICSLRKGLITPVPVDWGSIANTNPPFNGPPDAGPPGVKSSTVIGPANATHPMFATKLNIAILNIAIFINLAISINIAGNPKQTACL